MEHERHLCRSETRASARGRSPRPRPLGANFRRIATPWDDRPRTCDPSGHAPRSAEPTSRRRSRAKPHQTRAFGRSTWCSRRLARRSRRARRSPAPARGPPRRAVWRARPHWIRPTPRPRADLDPHPDSIPTPLRPPARFVPRRHAADAPLGAAPELPPGRPPSSPTMPPQPRTTLLPPSLTFSRGARPLPRR